MVAVPLDKVNEEQLKTISDIVDLTMSLPVPDADKIKALVSLMGKVQYDDDIDGYTERAIASYISKAMSKLNPDTHSTNTSIDLYDPDGILDDPYRTYDAKPIMVSPDQILRYSAMSILNLYNFVGMPCLVCVAHDFGICTYTSNITYEFIMELANRDCIDHVYFTDGNSVAVVK